MKHLPLIHPAAYKPLAPRMRHVNYLNPKELARSRDVDETGIQQPHDQNHQDLANALPTELLLLQGIKSDDPCHVLDVADSELPPVYFFDSLHQRLTG